MELFIGLVVVALTFGLAVFVHEFGHYIFARVRGVGVEAFAIGMGPKIVAWSHNGTEYSLRWFPIGGFVRLHQMVREEAEDQEREEQLASMAEEEQGKQPADGDRKSLGKMAYEDMEALYDKGLITKLLVFGGGVFFNFLTAMAAIALLFTIGFERPKSPIAWIGQVASDSPFAAAGLQLDDHLIEVEGVPVERIEEFEVEAARANKDGRDGDGLDVRVRRGDSTIALKLPAFDKSNEGLYQAGLAIEQAPVIGEAFPMAPASKAGLRSGDIVVAVNDKAVTRWSEVSGAIRGSLDSPVALKIRRGDPAKEFTVSLIPEENPMEPGTGMIGIRSAGSVEKIWIQESVFSAVFHAPFRTWEALKGLAGLQYSVVKTTVEKSGLDGLKRSLGGPIAIFKMTYERAKGGLRDQIDWFINLNLLLAIMNLLPIPILDGGFIVLSLIEGVIRRPVPTRILSPIYTGFALLFLTLFVYLSHNDFLKLIF